MNKNKVHDDTKFLGNFCFHLIYFSLC